MQPTPAGSLRAFQNSPVKDLLVGTNGAALTDDDSERLDPLDSAHLATSPLLPSDMLPVNNQPAYVAHQETKQRTHSLPQNGPSFEEIGVTRRSSFQASEFARPTDRPEGMRHSGVVLVFTKARGQG